MYPLLALPELLLLLPPGDLRLLLPTQHGGLSVGTWGEALEYRVAGAGVRAEL